MTTQKTYEVSQLSKPNGNTRNTSQSQLTNRINNLSHPRHKRSLINAIGIAAKWAFGTLDEEDGINMNKNLDTLNINYDNLHSDVQKQNKLIQNITVSYEKKFKSIEEQIHQIESETNKKFYTMERANQEILISIQLDNIINQINLLQQILTDIETAVSFAKINILHSSIIPS